jgi:starch phosphorylase
LAHWKTHIRGNWSGVQIRPLNHPQNQQLSYGESITLQVAVRLNNLQPQDVAVELVLSRKVYHPEFLRSSPREFQDVPTTSYKFTPVNPIHDTGEYLYTLTFKPEWCGGLRYRICVYPYHELLSHPHEMGMMVWM